jgi:hypothetical protein
MTRRAAGFAVAALAGLVVLASPAGAHGVGTRSDLPLDFTQFALGGATALVLSFVIVGRTWTRGRLIRAAAGRELPAWLDRVAAAAGWVGRVLAAALFVLTVVAAFAGPDDPNRNLAPYAVFVTMWVGAQLVCGVLGDVWRAISPFETLAALLDRIAPSRRLHTSPAWTPWLALGGLGGLLWLELGYHDGSRPTVLGVALVAYTAGVTAGTWAWGREWLRRAEGFGVLFSLIGAIGVFTRDERGLRIRPPVSGLALLRFGPATLAVVLVVLGGTTFDGLSGTEQWRDVIGARSAWDETVVNTVGLVAVIAAVAGAYLVFATLAGRVTESATDAALVFGPSLVPILLGYAVAHYFSLFVLDGQAVLRQLSDPFGRGSDWFGTADWQVDFRLISTTTIAWVQVLAIVGGHIAGVVVAHDRALDDEQPDVAIRSQYPLLAVMVLYTVVGLWLLWNA